MPQPETSRATGPNYMLSPFTATENVYAGWWQVINASGGVLAHGMTRAMAEWVAAALNAYPSLAAKDAEIARMREALESIEGQFAEGKIIDASVIRDIARAALTPGTKGEAR